MFIRLMGQFQVLDAEGRDHAPRGAKSRALVAMLCRTEDHCRPRRWLESRLWSDRGQEQASGSLRQALSELRKALGPLAVHLDCGRDCVRLLNFTTDLDSDPSGARQALEGGREFLEGIDIGDPAFGLWLTEERQRVAAYLGQSQNSAGRAFRLRVAALPEGVEPAVARDLAGAIARLTAEFLLRDGADRIGEVLPESLDLHVEGAWSGDRAHLKVRLVTQADQKTVWTQRLIASRSTGLDGQSAASQVTFETSDAPIM